LGTAAGTAPQHHEADAGFLAGGGEMGKLMRSLDWSQTALGPVDRWPQSLRTTVSICLNSRFPMILWWGPELTVLYNDDYIPVLGNKHPTRALGLPGHEVWAEVWPVIEPLLKRVMTKGEANWADDLLLFLNRTGYPEECYFRFSYSPISDETGGIGGVFTPVSDTTRRVVSERRLRTLRELAGRSSLAQTVDKAYASMAEALAENPYDIPFAAFYQVAPDRQQAHLVTTVGITPGSRASPQLISLTSPDDSPISAAARKLSVQTLSKLEDLGDLPLGPWGDPPSAVIIHPVCNPGQGNAESVLVAGVSARRHLDDSYFAFFELVAKQIGTALAAARTYEEEKQRAEALAELDRAKTTFFSNVSHEFRTPLTLMLGPLEEALAAPQLPPQIAEYLAMAFRNGLRLQKLVNTLLDFSRIEAGRMQASYRKTDLVGFTADLASQFRSLMEQAGLQFAVVCEPLMEPAWIDPEMWEKVVLNLLSNAFKYTLQGSVSVSMREQAGQALLCVRDTGIGIANRELPHLFERFHRVEGSRGRTQEGSGIGLALVAELVKMHGGSVSVESSPGEGTTFTVAIPLGTAHLPADRLALDSTLPSSAASARAYVDEAKRWLPAGHDAAPPEPAFIAAVSTPPNAAPEGVILLADDNADMRDYVKRLLENNYQVLTASNGQEAIERALANPPDLVLADVMMPELDGFQLLAALRANSSTRHIPVVLLSARAGEEARSEGMDAGADDYLIKPFSARELLARTGAHLRLSRLRKEAEVRESALRTEAEAARDQALNVLESITDGFFTLDQDWCFTYVNSEGARLLGAPLEQLRGKNHWDLYPSTVGAVVEHEYRRAVLEQRPVEFENFYVPWQRWFGVKAYPTQTGGLSVYFRDLTEHKKTEAAVRESEERFRQLADNISQSAWMADETGAVFWYNQRWYDYTGTTFDTVKGWGWQTLHHPDHLERVMERVKRCFANGEVWEDTFPLRGRHGQWRWFLSRARPIRDAHGKIVRWFGTHTDVTEQLEIEKELRQANRDLEQFAFSASHDLQEPLRTMALYSQLLDKRYGSMLDGEAGKFLGHIIDGSNRMSSLVSDLLTYVQAAVAADEPVEEPVDTELIFDDVLSSLNNTIRESNAQVTRSALPAVAVKDIHVQQLLQNLIGNALKYRKDEVSPCVHVSAKPTGSFWLFSVADNGIGIAPQFHAQIFAVFKRLHPKGGKYPGTGIGLSICQRIIERYGGKIWLESDADQGATFHFTLPAVVDR